MSGQLELEVETPLRFDVYAVDDRLLDSFTEDELACVALGRPEKAWHEAACWAAVAVAADKRAHG